MDTKQELSDQYEQAQRILNDLRFERDELDQKIKDQYATIQSIRYELIRAK